MESFDQRRWGGAMFDLREKCTLEELQELTGIGKTVLSRAMNGERINIITFIELCNLMGYPSSFFIREDYDYDCEE